MDETNDKEASRYIRKLEDALRDMVSVVEFYKPQGKYHGYSSNKSGEWENYPAEIIKDNGEKARQCLERNKELLEGLR